MIGTYQERRQVQARLRALTAVFAVVLGAAALSARRLPTGAATASRTTASTTMASALFATPTSVG